MNYVESKNDILINFQKIKYNSHVERERRAAISAEAKKRTQISERNAAKREVSVTRELSHEKNALSSRERIAINPKTVRRNTTANTASTPKASTLNTAAVRPAAKVGTARPVVRVNAKQKQNAAEFLFSSCEEKTYTETRAAKVKSHFPIAFFINAIVIALLFIMLIGSYSQLSEATGIKGEYENKIDVCLSENSVIKQKIAEKNDLAEIEKIAVEKLGMVKADSSNRGYISISGNDKIVVTEASDDGSQNVSVVMSSVSRLINNLMKKSK